MRDSRTQRHRQPAVRVTITGLATASMVAALAACTSMGEGSGSTRDNPSPVRFQWTSRDGGNTGTMRAEMSGGAVFEGPFLQISATLRLEVLDPMWVGWRRGWNDWRYWGPYAEPAFVTRYSGRVVANLRGPGEERMRCRFHLNEPAQGMRGGGQGECQATGGRVVDAVFSAS